ncbi:hypothetical protein QOZ80_8BG0650010 [Eleusine coracana subsp. coracana]|nr:hypothetical protein QOZ80_8BG0650010 [Eleusine coracana subsp. coracana]
MASPRETTAEAAPVSVSVRGFDPRFTARDLAGFLQSVADGEVLRCRIKTTWTPPNSCPNFELAVVPDAAAAAFPGFHAPRYPNKRRRSGSDDDDPGAAAAFHSTLSPPPPYDRPPPHAFVQFAQPDAASRAAARPGLLLRGPYTQNGHTSPRTAARRRTTTPAFRFTGSLVEAGNLRSPHDFVAAWCFPDDASSSDSGVDFVVEPSDETCRLFFSRDTVFTFPGTSSASAAVLRCDVKLEFPALDIDEVLVFQSTNTLLLRLASAPLSYYRTAADDVYQSPVPTDLIDDDDDDPWVRTTDVTGTSVIGRCWVYKVSFRAWLWPEMMDVLAYLKQRVPVTVCDDDGWTRLAMRDEPGFGQRMPEPFFFVQQNGQDLGFPVWFLLNALVHKGRVNEHQLTPEFFGLLRSEEGDVNEAALTEFLGDKFPVFDVCRRLHELQRKAATNTKLLRSLSSRGKPRDYYNVKVHSLVITPTRVYCRAPQVERSNRVIRHYHQVSDRFLRVTFTDEGMQLLTNNALYFHTAPIVSDMMVPNLFKQKTAVYRRVQRILSRGFHMCGRKYSFLAFSSNQLKNRSAWFFADDGTTTAASIREWMGHFPSKNVAKHAARMGLCFTSSYATVDMRPDEVNEFLEDVEHNGYNFSDGIGMISTELAKEVAQRLPLLSKDSPSAYQIRYAGFKGVVAVWPGQNDGIRLSLRPSMRKFESTNSVLEVVSWTRFQPGFLNRQIITLLTSLGVPEEVFWQMHKEMIDNLERILSSSGTAFEIAISSLAEHGNTLGLMLNAGFAPATEPHLRAMLLAIRSSQLQGLLEKTKIFVPKSRWLMGCLDELGILEQGQCFIRTSSPSLSSCVVTHGSRFSWVNKNAQAIIGTVVMAKNPCLHPGDVRILEAVDVPGLDHLVDCLVLPKKGERPHANEASGSDLDGDVYFVTWDENLIPPGKRSCDPMDYSPAEAKLLQRNVQQHDIIDFFLKNMTSDNIGRISNAHVVHADISKKGAKDEKCLQLAELAATAVDSHKTGKNVTMPSYLRPKEYPDFMGKDDDMSYKSEKILGRLYRSVKQYILGEILESVVKNDVPYYYDTDLEVPGASVFFSEAWQCKRSYEAQLNILLSQYSVRTEAELVTGEIWSLTENNRRKKQDIKEKKQDIKERLKYAYSDLQKQFRSMFDSIEAGHREVSDERKNMAYEMKASAWYQVTYHPVWVRRSREIEPNGEAKLSFAWIAVDYLAQIKMRRRI